MNINNTEQINDKISVVEKEAKEKLNEIKKENNNNNNTPSNNNISTGITGNPFLMLKNLKEQIDTLETEKMVKYFNLKIATRK